jgi:crossover junction endodeoxyribonuclease RuvC
MNFIGVDLSLTGTGVVVLDSAGAVVHQETIKTKPSGDRPIDETNRLLKILSGVTAVIEKYAAEGAPVVNIEGLAFMARNTTALVQLAGLNYLLRSSLVWSEIPFLITAPTSLKKYATGKGNGDKDMVVLEIYKRWGFSADNNNTGDAFVLAQIARAVSIEEARPDFQDEVIKLIKTQL